MIYTSATFRISHLELRGVLTCLIFGDSHLSAGSLSLIGHVTSCWKHNATVAVILSHDTIGHLDSSKAACCTHKLRHINVLGIIHIWQMPSNAPKHPETKDIQEHPSNFETYSSSVVISHLACLYPHEITMNFRFLRGVQRVACNAWRATVPPKPWSAGQVSGSSWSCPDIASQLPKVYVTFKGEFKVCTQKKQRKTW